MPEWCLYIFSVTSKKNTRKRSIPIRHLEGLQQCILRGGGPIVAFEESNEAIYLSVVRNVTSLRHSPHNFKEPTSSPACGIGLSISASSWIQSSTKKNIKLCTSWIFFAQSTAIPHTSSVGFCPNALNRMPTCHKTHFTKCPKKNSCCSLFLGTCCGFKRPQPRPVFSNINGLIESS